MKFYFTIFLSFSLSFIGFAQKTGGTATVFGTISEANSAIPIEFAIAFVKETDKSMEANGSGEYSLTVPANKKFTLRFQRVGYREAEIVVEGLAPNSQKRIDISLTTVGNIDTVVIKDNTLKDNGMIREKVEALKYLPSTTGNLESLLPNIALGTNSGSGGELTSQYQVRGGNYDENLVYVNDFEIYRPQLIRTGQQEGLSFPNIDLIRDITFSSGGFEARYGDKLSSVLDVRYKRPDSIRGSVAGSFLGGSAHLEGSVKTKDAYRKFRYLVGSRYKTTKYLLGGLQVKGEYNPSFTDLQTYLTYDLSRSWQVALMANYNHSLYELIPQESSQSKGLFNQVLSVQTVYEGKERNIFENGMGGVSFTFLPDRKRNPLFLKFLASRYQNREVEGLDITGTYILGQKETNQNSDNFGKIVVLLGEGTEQRFLRNYLYSTITNAEHKGGYEIQSKKNPNTANFLQWSLRYQHETIEDRINEWTRSDSALYSIPRDTLNLRFRYSLKSRNNLESDRLNASVQNTFSTRKRGIYEFQATAGVRASYWSLNEELTITPRVQLSYRPLNWQKDISFRLSGGLYYQPPFYREMRNPNGVVNTDLKAQKSAHYVGGFSYDFFSKTKRRVPFKFVAEAYYKQLWDIVSYEVDNVRVRYSGKNDADGYVAGLDMRLNGELVPDAESWINVSILQARERLDSVQHRAFTESSPSGKAVAYVPRPTDQLMTVSMFFQDYLKKNKNVRAHLNLNYGTGLPFSFPGDKVYRNTYRLKAYSRVDIGFSAMLWDKKMLKRKPNHPLRFTRNTWVSFEVFNLLGIQNESSGNFVRTFYNTQYFIPNALTTRRLNLRLRMDL